MSPEPNEALVELEAYFKQLAQEPTNFQVTSEDFLKTKEIISKRASQIDWTDKPSKQRRCGFVSEKYNF